ncbi:unnamed protein product [Caenorhabditis sp. 36 PRJEB53466]|nr:unnamed protein product [Caenorhabditis sp. 36 PRJEB53466]
MEPRLKIDVGASSSSTNGTSSAHTEARENPPQTMPPPSSDWNNQFSSPDAEDMGPFVEQLLPYVRASAYNWFHLQAAKRRYFKEFDRKMSAKDESRKLVELQNDRDDMKVKWASRLLGKIKKDIQHDHKDAFVSAINGLRPGDCILSVADQKGKMRRIDCLRQADKVWRLDLVTIILFKGIPLESTDGERLERIDSCSMPNLCINPFHMSIGVRALDIFMANYLKDVDTKILLAYNGDRVEEGEPTVVVKQEPIEQPIVAPQAILGTSDTHNRVWDTPVTLEYDPMQACHTYFGGRATYLQQSASTAYTYFVNKDAVDNNFFDEKTHVLRLPPPPAQSCLTTIVDFPEASTSGSQPLEISDDSNDEPLEKRSRDLSSHDSPNSSTNDEVRRIVESGESMIRAQHRSSIWTPTGSYARMQNNNQNVGESARPVRLATDFQNGGIDRPISFRPAKPVRRMTVNAGNHGDVGVVVVDARHQDAAQLNAQSLATALNSLRTSPAILRGSPIGRKRGHPHAGSQLDLFSAQYMTEAYKSIAASSSSNVSPPHAVVANLRESSGYTSSPTKFTTARGDTTSFSKIFQKVEEKHGQRQNQQQQQQPSTSYCSTPLQQSPYLINSKLPASAVKLIAPVPIKPQMVSISGCSSIVASPITTPRITPFRMLEEDSQSFVNVLGQLTNSSDSIQDQFLQYINESHSRSPLLSGSNGTFSALTMGAVNGLPPITSANRPDSSASNGSNSLTGAMGLIAPPTIALAVSQTPTAMSPLHPRLNLPPCSPSSSNSSLGAANQAPISSIAKDPNAPKLPTDFAQAMSNEKK